MAPLEDAVDVLDLVNSQTGMSRLREKQEPLHIILLCCDLSEVSRVASVCRIFSSSLVDKGDGGPGSIIWRTLNRSRTEGRAARFHIDVDHRTWPSPSNGWGRQTWRDRCKKCVLDSRRKKLEPEELRDFEWAFNFVKTAGGRGAETVQRAMFRPNSSTNAGAGIVILQRSHPLPYKLSPGGRKLKIAQFPVLSVARMNSWEWLMSNSDMRFVSCSRGFADVQRWTASQWERPRLLGRPEATARPAVPPAAAADEAVEAIEAANVQPLDV